MILDPQQQKLFELKNIYKYLRPMKPLICNLLSDPSVSDLYVVSVCH